MPRYTEPCLGLTSAPKRPHFKISLSNLMRVEISATRLFMHFTTTMPSTAYRNVDAAVFVNWDFI